MSQDGWAKSNGKGGMNPNTTGYSAMGGSVQNRQTQQTFFSQTNQGFGVTNLDGLDQE